jgi:23S rRNA (uridine2552-2'-O)-methyltransferase
MPPKRVLHDEYFKRAKAEGYLARSAYKLIQINDDWNLIRPGNNVLDMGCAPGAWIQVAQKLVGKRGRVVGIDLKPVPHNFGSRVTTLVGDIEQTDAADMLAPIRTEERPDRLFDVVVSDMAPNTGGTGDAERSAGLCQSVLDLLPSLLRPGGHMAMKILEGGGYKSVLDQTAAQFKKAKGFKPKASRDVSREMYIIGAGFKADVAEQQEAKRKLPPHLRWSEDEIRRG